LVLWALTAPLFVYSETVPYVLGDAVTFNGYTSPLRVRDNSGYDPLMPMGAGARFVDSAQPDVPIYVHTIYLRFYPWPDKLCKDPSKSLLRLHNVVIGNDDPAPPGYDPCQISAVTNLRVTGRVMLEKNENFPGGSGYVMNVMDYSFSPPPEGPGYTPVPTPDRSLYLATRTAEAKLRQACMLYYQKNRQWPSSLNDLIPDFLDMIPPEAVKGLHVEVNSLDGNGGWFYDPTTGELKVNLIGTDSYGQDYRSY